MTTRFAAGEVIGYVQEGPLQGWEIVATADGGAITMKSGSCWGQLDGGSVPAEVAWDAVTARLFAKMSDADLAARADEYAAEIAQRTAAGKCTLGSEAGLRVIKDEIARRKGEVI